METVVKDVVVYAEDDELDDNAAEITPGRQIPTENNEELRGVFRDGVSSVPRKKIPL